MRSPVTGIVTRADKSGFGTIAIRDANGFSHEVLHSRSQHVAVGDPVVAGQLIGTMGNTGLKVKNPQDANHVHYQLKDPAGKVIDPSAYWDQRDPFDPNPASPAFLDEYQRYLGGLSFDRPGNSTDLDAVRARPGPNPVPSEVSASAPFGTSRQFAPGSATSSQPLYETRSFVGLAEDVVPRESGKEVRRLVRLPASKPDLAGYDPNAPAPLPKVISPVGRSASFGDRFGNWTSFSGLTAPLASDQPVPRPPQQGRSPGLVPGRPMPPYPFPPPSFGPPDNPSKPGSEDWAWALVRPAKWDKKAR